MTRLPATDDTARRTLVQAEILCHAQHAVELRRQPAQHVNPPIACDQD